MQSQAYFEDIQDHIIDELATADASIRIAVAWLTNHDIFEMLCHKASSSVRVELIMNNDRINARSRLDYKKLEQFGGKIVRIGERGKRQHDTPLMHNKFCIIDAETIITGSYNWTNKAQINDENILVIRENDDLARQFMDEFDSILERNGEASVEVDHGKVLIRMEALGTVLKLEDDDDIARQLTKLKKIVPHGDEYNQARSILAMVEAEEYEEAISAIQAFITSRKQVAVYRDMELVELKLELKALEIQVSAMEDEKAEIERLLHAFQFRHSSLLGPTIRRILQIKAERLSKEAAEDSTKQAEYEEAQQDYDQFEEDDKLSLEKQVFELSLEELQEQKSLFRACSKLCHPDIVHESSKEEAADLFKKLTDANSCNDLNQIREIHENLKKGIFKAASDSLTDYQLIQTKVGMMHSKVGELSRSIRSMRASHIYKTIIGIDEWNEYFSLLRTELEEELAELEGM
jgi:hypothetical protein